jgi:hypothetical protein
LNVRPLVCILSSYLVFIIAEDGATALDFWYEALALGNVLPTMPLWLRGGPCMPVALEATYQRTCREQRIAVEPV